MGVTYLVVACITAGGQLRIPGRGRQAELGACRHNGSKYLYGYVQECIMNKLCVPDKVPMQQAFYGARVLPGLLILAFCHSMTNYC